MREVGVRNTVRPLLLRDADIEYTKTRNGYILGEFDGSDEAIEEAYRAIEPLPETYRLFPQGVLLDDGRFRRCDGVWIKLEDKATRALVSLMCTIASRGGYVDTLWDFTMVTRETIGLDMDRAVFAASQAIVCGICGEYSAYEMGYVPVQKLLDYEEGRNIYCGDLALWEMRENLKIAHMLIAHQFRKVIGNDETTTVIELIERRCAEKNIPGLPHPPAFDEYYRLACEIEAGVYRFVDSPPVEFTRIRR